MSLTVLSCMFQQRPVRATAETGGVISVRLFLFLPPAGLFLLSLFVSHLISLSHPFCPLCLSPLSMLFTQSHFSVYSLSRDPLSISGCAKWIRTFPKFAVHLWITLQEIVRVRHVHMQENFRSIQACAGAWVAHCEFLKRIVTFSGCIPFRHFQNSSGQCPEQHLHQTRPCAKVNQHFIKTSFFQSLKRWKKRCIEKFCAT